MEISETQLIGVLAAAAVLLAAGILAKKYILHRGEAPVLWGVLAACAMLLSHLVLALPLFGGLPMGVQLLAPFCVLGGFLVAALVQRREP